ncbi:hypothetical protein L596_011194 [Steinernema carpocapsae]|uniref:HELP domain-containing protein n=2 Tax=Steinernema carpocapsae TaxID=34508 RepID=A0A4U5NU06_STECR|nr:hypothetical protein L596_011194 [Steinernema carpocapsae]
MSAPYGRRPVHCAVFEPFDFPTPSSVTRSLVQDRHVASWNEMIGVENASLRERVAELERKVHHYEDEMVLMRSTTADVLRRMTQMEATIASLRGSRGMSPSNSVFDRLANANGTSRATRSSSISNRGQFSTPPSPARTPQENGATSTLPRKYQKNPRLSNGTSTLNIPTGRSPRGSPLRKSMSTLDVKRQTPDANNNAGANAATPSVMSKSFSSKSSNRLGSLRSLGPSMRSVTNIGSHQPMKDPQFNEDERELRVFVGNSRGISIPAPSDVVEVNPLREIAEPDYRLKLEWVHGYHGKRSRNNLHILNTGEVCYFVGSIVVLENVAEKKQRHYTEHTCDITSIAVHSNGFLVASGQSSRHLQGRNILSPHRKPISSERELDAALESEQTQAHIRIWDYATLKTKMTIGVYDNSFERSIVSLSFSGHQLVAVDEKHFLSFWDISSGNPKRTTMKKVANESVFSAQFHSSLTNILVSHGKSHFNFITTNANGLNVNEVKFEGRDKPKCILSVAFTDQGAIVAGDSSGGISLWDPKTFKMVSRAPDVHPGGVFALLTLRNGHILSGGKDQRLSEWTAQDLVRIHGPLVVADDCGTIRTLAQGPDGMIYVGTMTNSILVGDMRSAQFRCIVRTHHEPVCGLAVHSNGSSFTTCSNDGNIFMWDVASMSLIREAMFLGGAHCISICPANDAIVAVGGISGGTWRVVDSVENSIIFASNESESQESVVSAIRFSPDSKFLVIATSDKRLIFLSVSSNLKRYAKIHDCQGISSPVFAVDWSSDSKIVRINTRNNELAFYCASSGKLLDEPDRVRDAEWASTTCPLRYETACIVQTEPGVIAASGSQNGVLNAITVDSGAVRLYSNPTTSINARYVEAFGHSANASNVAFVQSGSRLITVGSEDAAVFQWRIEGNRI